MFRLCATMRLLAHAWLVAVCLREPAVWPAYALLLAADLTGFFGPPGPPE